MSDTRHRQQVDCNGVLRGPLDRHTDARLDILYLDDHRIDRVELPAHRPGPISMPYWALTGVVVDITKEELHRASSAIIIFMVLLL